MSYRRRAIATTTDAILAPSGSVGEVCEVHVTGGGTAPVVNLYDGQDANGTLILAPRAAANGSLHITNMRLPFTNGLFVDVDSNTTLVTVGYEGAKP